MAPVLELGCAAILRREGGQKGACARGPFGYSFSTCKQKLGGPLLARIDSFVPDGWRVRGTFLRPHLFLLQLELAVTLPEERASSPIPL